MDFGRDVWAEIDLSAVRRNLELVKERTGAGICAVVKADAYGHGALAVAHEALAAGSRYLGVAILNEALELRTAGVTAPILILGHSPISDSRTLADNKITQTVYRVEQAEVLAAAARAVGRTAKIHLKIDTGMSRLGVRPEDAAEFAERVNLPGLELEGVFTHFAQADSHDRAATLKQLTAFNAAVESIKARGMGIPIVHAANSAAILQYPEAHFDMVRPGIILYGLRPSSETPDPGLVPAMRLKARIALIKEVAAGTAVSYGGRHITREKTRLATLPLGYADGFSRGLSGKWSVIIRGRKAPIVGRICMDQCLADVGHIPEVAEGDEALIFGGAELPIDDAARILGTINYEIACQVSQRVPRRYA